MDDQTTYRTRKVLSGKYRTPSYQFGYYEMRTQETTGKRRSYFKVVVNLDEHETPQQAITAWSDEVERLRGDGRTRQADKLQGKLDKLRDLTREDS